MAAVPLDTTVWTEAHLRAWATEFADANLVQAKQMLLIFAELDGLRAEVANSRKFAERLVERVAKQSELLSRKAEKQ